MSSNLKYIFRREEQAKKTLRIIWTVLNLPSHLYRSLNKLPTGLQRLYMSRQLQQTTGTHAFPSCIHLIRITAPASYNASVKFQMKPPWAYLWGYDATGPRDPSNAALVIYFSTHSLSFLSMEIKDCSSTRSHTFKFLAIIISEALRWYNKQRFHCQETAKNTGKHLL